jgi:hypothetical protein
MTKLEKVEKKYPFNKLSKWFYDKFVTGEDKISPIGKKILVSLLVFFFTIGFIFVSFSQTITMIATLLFGVVLISYGILHITVWIMKNSVHNKIRKELGLTKLEYKNLIEK